MSRFSRGSGILLHPTSIPSEYGIGDLGENLIKFLELLKDNAQKYWQILPIGPTGYGDSPYQSLSSFAGNPLLISIDDLIAQNLISSSNLNEKFNTRYINFAKVKKFKFKILKEASRNFDYSNPNFQAFKKTNNDWLSGYSTYMALKEAHSELPWYLWDSKYRDPVSSSVSKFQNEFSFKIDFHDFTQYIFYEQWSKIKMYTKNHGISIIGDLPIFVAHDSADVWLNQSLYFLNSDRTLKYQAGVPPDYFSSTGQLWGNPLYNWEFEYVKIYDFWLSRIKNSLNLVDILRLDHFRGFDAYWCVPGKDQNAINGTWKKGPGRDFFHHINDKLGDLPFIAEDLGFITESVKELRDDFQFPGMKILHYAFSDTQDSKNEFLPHNYSPNCVVYIGTHDNDTTIGWWGNQSEEIKNHVLNYSNSTQNDIISIFLELASSSKAAISIFTLQDIMRLDTTHRMNLPGTSEGNWQWRFKFEDLNLDYMAQLKQLTIENKRS
ncbi:MAG: 4-alpha-glucanotransferase [Candidatus Heimdallarchaeota archaeon]|nr:4-alpha-glucanotransferase [Candidatus Heimdallarchaeota archaeon]|tara:strand:+ start:2500 stop:3978 length:1479 start_codon:yes stop_codon:yes gene_type:complete